MKPFTQVQNSENSVFGYIVQHVFNEGEGVCVRQGSLINLAIVHNEQRGAIFSSPSWA